MWNLILNFEALRPNEKTFIDIFYTKKFKKKLYLKMSINQLKNLRDLNQSQNILKIVLYYAQKVIKQTFGENFKYIYGYQFLNQVQQNKETVS